MHLRLSGYGGTGVSREAVRKRSPIAPYLKAQRASRYEAGQVEDPVIGGRDASATQDKALDLTIKQGNKKFAHMRAFLTGVSCVGKTTIGAKLVALLGYSFFDLGDEIERFFGISFERLQNKFLTMHSYREEASKVLIHILTGADNEDSIIALPPSGLMGSFWRVVKKDKGTVIVLTDEPENILQRITFYDIDSRPIHKHLTEKEKKPESIIFALKTLLSVCQLPSYCRPLSRSTLPRYIGGIPPAKGYSDQLSQDPLKMFSLPDTWSSGQHHQ
jgi:shikimate kinase